MNVPTDEVKSIKSELESDLKEAVQGLRSDLKDLKGGLSGLVTRTVCEAKHEAAAAHVTSLEKQIVATEGRIVSAVQLVKAEVSSMVNGKLEDKVKELVPQVMRDPTLTAGMAEDVTARMELSRLRGEQEQQEKPRQRRRTPTGLVSRIGGTAQSITAIITLAVMLVGGCVTGSYYLAGIATVVKQAAEAAKASASKQEVLLREQRVVMQRLEDRPPPAAVVEVPPDEPLRPAGKVPRRAAAKRAVSP